MSRVHSEALAARARSPGPFRVLLKSTLAAPQAPDGGPTAAQSRAEPESVNLNSPSLSRVTGTVRIVPDSSTGVFKFRLRPGPQGPNPADYESRAARPPAVHSESLDHESESPEPIPTVKVTPSRRRTPSRPPASRRRRPGRGVDARRRHRDARYAPPALPPARSPEPVPRSRKMPVSSDRRVARMTGGLTCRLNVTVCRRVQ